MKILIEQGKMRKFSVLKEKIFQYLEYKNITKSEFYRNTGISNGTLSQVSELGGENLIKILSTYRELSADWLFRNEGQMIRANKENLSVTNVANIQGNNNNNIQNTDNMLIDSLRKAIEAQEETIKVQRDLITSLQDEVFCLNRDQKK
jgi:hypothetical protein